MPDAAARMPQYAELPGQSGIGARFYLLLPPSLHGGRLNKFLAMPRHEADHSAGAQTHNVHCRDLKEPTEADAL